MAKRVKKIKKSNPNYDSKLKMKSNLKGLQKKERKIIQKTFYYKKDFITDLNFIDKYEEDEKKRIKMKDKENLIKIQNKKLYSLKICYRPSSNNIELIGSCLENEKNNNNNKKAKKNVDITSYNKKCCYVLIKDNNIIVPFLIENIKNIENNSNNNKLINNLNEKDKKEKIENKNKIRKFIKNKNKQIFYMHICKRNLINCLLINEECIINYILIFLSGSYSGYFEELNKHNSLILKVDFFQLFFSFSNPNKSNNFDNINIIGNGQDEYGEYIIKGNLNLISNLEQYKKENHDINIKNNDNVLNFGNIVFHKIYNI